MFDVVGKGPDDGGEGVLNFWSHVLEGRKESSRVRTCADRPSSREGWLCQYGCWPAGRCEGEILKFS